MQALYLDDTLVMPMTVDLPGLSFRGFRGPSDYAAMVAVIEGSKEADGIERVSSLADVARTYEHLVNSDPYADMIFAEVDGQVVGYSRVWWEELLDGARLYGHFVFLLPAFRRQGIEDAMLAGNESRLRQIAAAHPAGPKQFNCWVSQSETNWRALLESAGYQPVRYGFSMVRPDLENIPDLPLPAGLEVRPAHPDNYRTIWEAAREAFRDHWGMVEWPEEQYAEWRELPTFMPQLWQVAWAGDEVAGMVLNFIDEAENAEYGRRRGYTETIGVRRPWRRLGLARALLARSFQVLKDQGMTEAALGVDAENISGALRLYQSMGFQVVKQHTTYRKPL